MLPSGTFSLWQIDVLELELDGNANDRGGRFVDELAIRRSGAVEVEFVCHANFVASK